jgi:hypothetical protein
MVLILIFWFGDSCDVGIRFWPVAWRDASKGLVAASTGYGKTLLSSGFVGTP